MNSDRRLLPVFRGRTVAVLLVAVSLVAVGVAPVVAADNSAPTARFDYSPDEPQPGDTVTFDATRSKDGDGTIEEYAWDFDGDGTVDARGETVRHAFDEEQRYGVELTVTDDDGATDTLTLPIDVWNPPPEPEISVSPATPSPDETVTFDASASTDPRGRIERYEWDLDDDGNFGEYDEEGRVVEHAFESTGKHRVRLRVTDDGGKTVTVKRRVTVENTRPEADIGFDPNWPVVGETVTFDAADSVDPDGTIEAYEWDLDGDGVFGEYGEEGRVVEYTFEAAGEYPIRLRVTDNAGTTATDEEVVTVGNDPPTAAFDVTPAEPVPDERVVFDAGPSSDPEGKIEEYLWDLDGDGEFGEYGEVGRRVTTSYEVAGNYTVSLRVHDHGEKSDTVTRTITVGNTPPRAAFTYTPEKPLPGETITFDAADSVDPDGSIESYEWDLDGDGEFGEHGENGATVEYTFDEEDAHFVRLRVSDNGRKSDTVKRRLFVGNKRPTVGFEFSPETPKPGQTVSLDASQSTDPDGNLTVHEWDLDDDGRFDDATGARVTATFEAEGNHVVRVRVVDEGGKAATASATVRVRNDDPRPRIGYTAGTLRAGKLVLFDAADSTDPDGTIESYEWDLNGDGEFEKRGATVDYTFGEAGEYAVSLRVTDDSGATATAKRTVRVVNDAPEPTFAVRPADPLPGETVQFDATDSVDPDGTIESYEWDLDGDGEFGDRRGATATYAFEAEGQYTVALRVRDNGNRTTTVRSTVVVDNARPTPALAALPSAVSLGETVVLNATRSGDEDGRIVRYEWDLDGDGRFDDATGAVVEAAFDRPGAHNVSLLVVDSAGATARLSRTVTVRREVGFSLTGTRTNVTPGTDAVLLFSATNYLNNSPVEVQLVLETPSGVSVSAVQNADSGSNQVTAVATVEAGQSRNVQIRLRVNEPGVHEVVGTAVYSFGGEDAPLRYNESLVIHGRADDTSGPPVTESDSVPGFGVPVAVAALAIVALLRRRGRRAP